MVERGGDISAGTGSFPSVIMVLVLDFHRSLLAFLEILVGRLARNDWAISGSSLGFLKDCWKKLH